MTRSLSSTGRRVQRLLGLGAFAVLSSTLVACTVKKAPTTPVDYAAKDILVAHQTFELQSKILGDLRKIAVYVPPQYATDPARQFPVLYMPDGGLKQDFAHVSHSIDQLIAKGTIPPMIVVGVESIDRYRELTTPASSRKWKKRLPQAGGAASLHAFFESELKPEIAKRYRTKGMPTGLIGESLAGRWVVDGWTQYPERYDVWIAIDPSLWWNDSELLGELGPRIGDGRSHKNTRLYMSGAYRNRHGGLPHVHSFVGRLKTLGLGPEVVTFGSYPDLDHTEIFRSTEKEIYEAMFGK